MPCAIWGRGREAGKQDQRQARLLWKIFCLKMENPCTLLRSESMNCNSLIQKQRKASCLHLYWKSKFAARKVSP